MEKPLIFISHITEESEVATALRDFINKAFLGIPCFFVSSDNKSIPAGKKWLESISVGLKKCCCELLLCSAKSITRPWINFEAGAGWVRDITVVPLCYAGLDIRGLPVPLSYLQSVSLMDEKSLISLIESLSNSLGVDVPTPNYQDFINEITPFVEEYTFWDDLNKVFRQIKEVCPEICSYLQNALCSDGVYDFRLGEFDLREIHKSMDGIITKKNLFTLCQEGNAGMCHSETSGMRWLFGVRIHIPDTNRFTEIVESPEFTEWEK